jgi:hypothetical protein
MLRDVENEKDEKSMMWMRMRKRQICEESCAESCEPVVRVKNG